MAGEGCCRECKTPHGGPVLGLTCRRKQKLDLLVVYLSGIGWQHDRNVMRVPSLAMVPVPFISGQFHGSENLVILGIEFRKGNRSVSLDTATLRATRSCPLGDDSQGAVQSTGADVPRWASPRPSGTRVGCRPARPDTVRLVRPSTPFRASIRITSKKAKWLVSAGGRPLRGVPRAGKSLGVPG